MTNGLQRRGQRRGRPGQGERKAEDARPRRGPEGGGAGGERTVGDGGQDDVVSGREGCDLHAQGGRAELGSTARTRCAHWQIHEEARGGVIEVCACATEAV